MSQEARESDAEPCTVPPPGWWCSRGAGHDGPCAARPRQEFTTNHDLSSEDEALLSDVIERAIDRVRQKKDCDDNQTAINRSGA